LKYIPGRIIMNRGPGIGKEIIRIKEDKMIDKNKYYVIFRGQMGDSLSAAIVGSHLTELIHLLDRYCNFPYAEGIDEFAPILRVDGDIGHWEFEGLQRLRLLKKRKYISVDIGMPRSRWKNVSPLLIRQYLLTNLKMALEAFVKKLKKEHIPVDDKRLFEDFSKVEKEYLILD
jgi:hypothetical protein